jgi:hypothetical protein
LELVELGRVELVELELGRVELVELGRVNHQLRMARAITQIS